MHKKSKKQYPYFMMILYSSLKHKVILCISLTVIVFLYVFPVYSGSIPQGRIASKNIIITPQNNGCDQRNLTFLAGLAGEYARGHSVEQTDDNGYIVAGRVSLDDPPERNFLILKFDMFGEVEWATSIDYRYLDVFYSVCQTPDGGYIATGTTQDYGSDYDVMTVKFSPVGGIDWARLYDAGEDDLAFSAAVTSEGNFIVVGNSNIGGTYNHQITILKYSAVGNLIWNICVGGNDTERGHEVRSTSDNCLLVAGETNSYGRGFFDFLLIKIDENGNLIWACSSGRFNSEHEPSIYPTQDGGVILAGRIYDYSGDRPDNVLIKYDSEGYLTWASRTDWLNNHDCVTGVQQTESGDYIISSHTFIGDSYIFRYGSNGEFLTGHAFTGPYIEMIYSMDLTSDGGCISTGLTGSYETGDCPFVLWKTDENGWSADCDMVIECEPSCSQIEMNSAHIEPDMYSYTCSSISVALTPISMEYLTNYICPPLDTTPTPSPTISPTPTPTTPELTPIWTPTPSATPSTNHWPVFTPVYTLPPAKFTYDLILNDQLFTAGDLFDLSRVIVNHRSTIWVLEIIILDIHGSYFYYPTWRETQDGVIQEITQGKTMDNILLFHWPEGDFGSGHDLLFWGACLDSESMELIGEYDFEVFGYYFN